jgi:hypothetical protein
VERGRRLRRGGAEARREPRVEGLGPTAADVPRPPPAPSSPSPQRFYVGRPMSGLVWLFTGGLFGIGWLIDLFLLPQFVEEVRELGAARLL